MADDSWLSAQIDGAAGRRGSDERREALVVGVLAGGEECILGYGRLRDDGSEPPDARSLFEIGSITKVFTATLLAGMVVDGEAGLDDPLAARLPAGVGVPARDGRQVTLADLATHSSGLPRLPEGLLSKGLLSDRHDPYANFGEEQLHRVLTTTRLRSRPGERFHYSNFGGALLGEALANTAGTTYAELVRRRIAGPLDMTDTVVELSDGQAARFAQGHTFGGRAAPAWHLPAFAGAGALRSTAADMLLFLRANLHLPADPLGAAVTLTHEPRLRVNRQMQIGLGWLCWERPKSGLTIYWHNGGTGGFRSFAGFAPAAEVAVVVLHARARSVDRLGLRLLEGLAAAHRPA
jgi:CubicO group peptidase (beta-lactamase class C family)